MKDFVTTVNYHIERRHRKQSICSNTITIYNRSRPKISRSLQAKRYISKGLICAKKPSQAEDKSNICTHYQRCYLKNEKHSMFEQKNKDCWQFNLIISKGNEAYRRPGKYVGMIGARNQVIFQPVGEERTICRKLPQHDYVNPKVYITPATHRFLKKEVEIVKEEEELITTNDQAAVVIRPRFCVQSNGTTWARKILRYMTSTRMFMKNIPVFSTVCVLKLKVMLHIFVQTTTRDDVSCVTNKSNCCFKQCENERIEHLINVLSKAKEAWEMDVKEDENQVRNKQRPLMIESLDNAIAHLETKSGKKQWKVFDELIADGNRILKN